ncbi:hypothetical protein ACH4M8_18625 [Streptomyces albidoflavus]
MLPIMPDPNTPQGLDPLSPERLAEIAARAEAATAGPWGFYDGDNYADVAADLEMTGRGSYSCRQQVARLEDESYWDDPAHEDDDEERASEQMAADAAFIAAARTDVPALLAEVDRLRAERDRYQSAWQSARFRAEARGEGILREVKNRDFWQEEAQRLRAEPAARPPASPQVWLLMQGEDHEGGDVLGVFVTRDAARGEFIAAARRLHFEIDGAEEREGGSLHLHAGCDWLSLTPHAVATTEAIEAGESR